MPSLRTASVEVRRHFRTYTCRLLLSDDGETIQLVGVMPRGSDQRIPHTIEWEIYMRVLSEPQLRASAMQQLFHDTPGIVNSATEEIVSAKANDIGLWGGLTAFAVAGGLIYGAYALLARHFDEESAYLITFLPALFAFMLIFPIRDRVATHVKRYYCNKRGHILKFATDSAGSGFVVCERCDTYLKGTRVESS